MSRGLLASPLRFSAGWATLTAITTSSKWQ